MFGVEGSGLSNVDPIDDLEFLKCDNDGVAALALSLFFCKVNSYNTFRTKKLYHKIIL